MTKYAAITGWGSAIPEKTLTNADLEKMVDTSDEWITTRTGIKERRIVGEGESTVTLAVTAARKALECAGVSPWQVDLIICCTATPDYLFPATACLVQHEIGAENAGAFDLEAACSGFIYGIAVGSQFVTHGRLQDGARGGRRGIIALCGLAGSSHLRAVRGWRRRCSAPGQRGEERAPFICARLARRGRGSHQAACGRRQISRHHRTVQNRAHFIKMNGQETYRFAVRIMGDAALEALEKSGLQYEDISLFVPHQANLRIISSIADRLRLDQSKVFIDIEKYGNTSAASIPIALCEAIEQGRVKDGDNILFIAFGAGLTSAAAILKWGR